MDVFESKSGLELCKWNFKNDVEVAIEYDISSAVPMLKDNKIIHSAK